MEEPVVGGLSPSHEDGTSGAKKPEARAALSHVARRPSTPQDALSVAVYNQMFMILGKIEGRRRRGGQRMRWLDGPEQLERPAGFPSSDKTRPDSPVPTLQGPWALSLPDKELCLREALAVCTPPAPEPSAKRPGS